MTRDGRICQLGDLILKISFITNARASSGRNVQIDGSVTGRNTQYGYPSTVCADIPPYPAGG